MKNRACQLSGSRVLMTGTVLMIVAGTLVAAAFNPFKTRRRALMVESMNKGRQVKLSLDSFAMDNDGVYPSRETAVFYEMPKDGKWANDLFLQLFASGNTNSERIFWVKGAKVCNPKAPDDVISTGGKFDPKETLKAGDCGWAYVQNQTSTVNLARPILLDAYLPGGKGFDRKLWDDKVLVIRIDGSVMAVELNAKGEVLEDGEDILSAKSAIWKDSGQDPVKLLVQPEPVKAPEAENEQPAKAAAEASSEEVPPTAKE